MLGRNERYKNKLRYNNNYNKLNYKNISMRFHLVKDRDIIEWLLNFDNIKDYVSTIIRRDIDEVTKKHSKTNSTRVKKDVNKGTKINRKKDV